MSDCQGPRQHTAAEYRRRENDRSAQAARLERHHEQLGTLRLLIAAASLFAAWAALDMQLFSARWLFLALIAFTIVVLFHAHVRRVRNQARRALAFYRRGLARIEDRWSGLGETGLQFADSRHLYSADLDLFGPGSLFELLCIARTRMGQNTLAKWLLSPADVKTIRERQTAVIELRERIDLREDIALLGNDDSVVGQPQALVQWAREQSHLPHQWLLPAAIVLAAAFVISIYIAWRTGLIWPLISVIAIEAALAVFLRRSLPRAIANAEAACEGLAVLTMLLARLEREPFESAQLRMMQECLRGRHHAASHLVGKLTSIARMLESRRNPLLQLLDVPLMYSVQMVLAAERWRREHGRTVDAWLEAVGTIEALISLAAYSHEHPEDAFPQFVDGPATFVASELGHPLLPAARCIRNDVTIAQPTRVLLISGSNMSGKSTLLRTVGINAVLAMMRAPVHATRMSLTAVQVGASIRINDSLHEGSSRFYAEITRIRALFECSGRQPALLFLLDEVLQGTNSHDRRVGAEWIVRSYLGRGAIGLISTHDLALVDIDQTGQLHNLHFQDEFCDGRMTFDYRLRKGVVEKSNGVALMRAIGLDV